MKFKQSSPDPKASTYKVQRTFWICKPAEDILQRKEWRGKRSRLIDFLLCDFFGISYEEAYGRKASRHGKEQKSWDALGIYRKADIVLGTNRKQMSVEELKLLLQKEGRWPSGGLKDV
jgi:hypothetical protein